MGRAFKVASNDTSNNNDGNNNDDGHNNGGNNANNTNNTRNKAQPLVASLGHRGLVFQVELCHVSQLGHKLGALAAELYE